MPTLLRRIIIILLLQIFLYSFITEWFIVIFDGVDLNITMEIALFILLVIPLLYILNLKNSNLKYEIFIYNILPISLFFLILPIFHFSILYKYDIFNRRIGTENIALIFGDMGGLDKLIMKLYDTSQFFFIIIGFYILKANNKIKYKRIFTFTFIINIIYIVSLSISYSRSALMIFLILFYIVDGMFGFISKRIKHILLIIGITFFILVSLLRYVPMILLSNSIDLKDVLKNEFLYRANCSQFLNEVYTASKFKGYLYGETFTTPFLTLKSILGDEKAKEKISDANTGSKQYILSNYLGKDNKDECSCVAVDSFVNFGFFGILILLFIYLFWIFLLKNILQKKIINIFYFTCILSILSSILLYEADGLSLIFAIVKFIPAIFLFTILNPLSIHKIQHN
jgi:hypothetical protein